MELKYKYFDELTTAELYEILRARAEIFVVEQNCVYQDLDGIDQNSLHIFLEKEGRILAYIRAFRKHGEKNTVQIGRVLTAEHGKGLGGKILKEGLHIIRQQFQPEKMYLEAQCYAVGF